MSARRSKAAFALQRKTHAAAALGDRDALSTLLSTPKTCSWSWFTRRSSTPSDLIDPCTGDTLLHAAVRGPEPTCRSLITELLTGSDQLPAIDSRVVNFALATPLHAALSERRLAAAEVLLDSAALACPAETLLNAKDIHNFTALDYACDAALWPTAGRLCALGARPEECDRFARALEPAMAWPASVGEAAARRASAEAAPSVLSTLFEAAKWQAKSASIRVQESRIDRMAAVRSDSCMSAVAFRSIDEVLSWRAEAIARVAEALSISPAEAEKALKAAAWDEPLLLSQWRGRAALRLQRGASAQALSGRGGAGASSSSCPAAAGASQAESPAAVGDKGKAPLGASGAAETATETDRDAERDDECLVCFDVVPQGPGTLRLACRHAVCAECWSSHVRARCDEGDVVRGIRCPAGFCGEASAPKQLAAVVPPDVLARLERLSAQAFVDTAPGSMRWCPRPVCGAAVRLQFAENGRDFALDAARAGRALDASCPACTEAFCWSCGGAAHEPAACSHVSGWAALARSAEADAAAFSQEWVARNTKLCPVCANAIEKHSGCNHMSCRCGHQFCWVCMKPWSIHNLATGGSWSCMIGADGNDGAARQVASSAVQRSEMAPQVVEELQAAIASAQRFDAEAFVPFHEALLRAARIADESAAVPEGAQDNISGQKLRAWKVEQTEWATTLRAADAALKECMRGVSNGHIYLWHMAPGPQRVYVSHLLASLQADAAILAEAARLVDRGERDALPSGQAEPASAPGQFFSAIHGFFSFAAGPAAFLRERARETALREVERLALERRCADAAVFLRSLALRARRAQLEAAVRAEKADLERLLFCIRSGAVKAPPQHWAQGRTMTGAAARLVANAAGSVVDGAWRAAGRLAGFVATRFNMPPIASNNATARGGAAVG